MTDLPTVIGIAGATGLVTGIGALPVFVRARVSHRTYDAALGLAAGLMIAASVFGLILPGTEEGSLEAVLAGLLVGGFGLLAGNRLIPHLHARYRGWRAEGGATRADVAGMAGSGEVGEDDLGSDAGRVDEVVEGGATATVDATLRRALLVGGAITLHNAPEGLAIGVAFASGLEEVALVLAVVIGLQNVPDGFAFAVPMAETGASSLRVLAYTALSGTVPQVLAATVGFSLVSLSTGLFPAAAGFAAGAMLAVVFREMIPSSHGHGHADAATAAFLAGFVLLVVVDAVVVA
ncbi:ZIP family metal transporter [Halorubrum halodurans]|uniref:ZIP family metal transporter n=1 Tax=Halorubrum halodurans TaxID=1383851 RepID=A0A256IKK4_9EURY|nr:ZIP family metal transporter [Halorubrum halodurans]OYR57045.1 ZIP family metal transporter [Halorubrum halodurans]